jgi:hypothetical protein
MDLLQQNVPSSANESGEFGRCGTSYSLAHSSRAQALERPGKCSPLVALLPVAKRASNAILDHNCHAFDSVYRPILDAGGLVRKTKEETTLETLDVVVLRSLGFPVVRVREMETPGI